MLSIYVINKKKKVFGIPLSELKTSERKCIDNIPGFLQKAFDYFNDQSKK